MANTKITTNVIADDAITTAKIADDAVGNDQLASGLTLGGNTAATLSTAAQPNITSVGTLTGLDIGTNSHTGANPTLGLAVDIQDYVAQFANTRATAGQNYGVRVLAGSNSSDKSFLVKDKSNSSEYFLVRGDGNIGIGTNAPGEKLVIKGTTSFMATNSTNRWMAYTYTDNTFRLNYNGAGADEVVVDNSGRVGVGGTPNTNWRNDATDRVLTLGTEAALHSDAGVTTELWNNAYVNNSDQFLNISTRGASRYMQYSGAHKWFTAASANAGSTISTEINSTPKMVLDITGKLGIGTSSPVHDLHIHKAATGSQSRIQLTNGNTGATNADGYAIGMETDGRLYHWLYENAQMQFATNNEQRMSITAAGAIEIKGTSTTANAQAFITNDNSLLSIGSSVSGSVVKDIQFSSPGAKMYIDGSTGYVGIGTTAPGSFLEIRKTTAGSITGGTNNQGATLTLHHEAQWENGYTGGDFLGALNFSSGDGSTGEGVRAAIKTSSDTYYNTNRMRFYVAGSNNATLTERMQIRYDGNVGIGSTDPTRKLVVISTGSATYSGSSAGSNIALQLSNLESGAAGRTVGIGFSSESNAEVYLNCVTESGNNGGDFVIASRNGGTRAEKMRVHAAGSITKPLHPCFVAHLAANASYNSGLSQLNGTGWTVVHINTGSHFSTSTGKFTAPVTGVYTFTVNLATGSGASATTYWSAEIYVQPSGGSVLRVLGGWNEHTAGYQRTEATYTRYLTAGTTVWPGMESAMNITLLGSSSGVYSRFEGYLIG